MRCLRDLDGHRPEPRSHSGPPTQQRCDITVISHQKDSCKMNINRFKNSIKMLCNAFEDKIFLLNNTKDFRTSKNSKVSSRLSGSMVWMLYSVHWEGSRAYPHSGWEWRDLYPLSLIILLSSLEVILCHDEGLSSSSSSSIPSSISFNLKYMNYILAYSLSEIRHQNSIIGIWKVLGLKKMDSTLKIIAIFCIPLIKR